MVTHIPSYSKGGFGNSTSQSTLVGPPLDYLWIEGIPDFVDNNRGIPVDPMEQVMECQMAYSIKVQVGLLSVDDEGIAAGKVGLWMEFISRNHHRVCQWNG